MTNEQKCWYSVQGLEQLRRKQRSGVVLGEDEEFMSVLWDGNKTPNKLAKIFVTTDPLVQLIKNDVEESPYIDIDETTWFSIEKGKVHIVREDRKPDGEYLGSETFVVGLEEIVQKVDENTLIEIVQSFILPTSKPTNI